MADTDTARTILAILAGFVAIIAVFVILLVVFYYREKKIQLKLQEHEKTLKALLAHSSSQGSAKADNLKDFLSPFVKKCLLSSAFDLSSRLYQQVNSNFMYKFTHEKKERDAEYALHSTMYMVAEFLGWMELIRQKIVFVTGSEIAEPLNLLFDSIRFQFTGETEMQGFCKPGDDGKLDLNRYDKHPSIMQLYIVDIRSIGNAMLKRRHEESGQMLPMTVDEFLRLLKLGRAEDPAWMAIMSPLEDQIKELSNKGPGEAPRKRLAIIQVLLCKLIALLDPAVPWAEGAKFDDDEEPMYIRRDMRLTPLVNELSDLQKNHLASCVFFEDDPNLSFPGFREDLKDRPQAERDALLWPGACPPREPRMRSKEWRLKQNSQNQGGSSWVRRRSSSATTIFTGTTTVHTDTVRRQAAASRAASRPQSSVPGVRRQLPSSATKHGGMGTGRHSSVTGVQSLLQQQQQQQRRQQQQVEASSSGAVIGGNGGSKAQSASVAAPPHAAPMAFGEVQVPGQVGQDELHRHISDGEDEEVVVVHGSSHSSGGDGGAHRHRHMHSNLNTSSSSTSHQAQQQQQQRGDEHRLEVLPSPLPPQRVGSEVGRGAGSSSGGGGGAGSGSPPPTLLQPLHTERPRSASSQQGVSPDHQQQQPFNSRAATAPAAPPVTASSRSGSSSALLPPLPPAYPPGPKASGSLKEAPVLGGSGASSPGIQQQLQ